MTVSAGLQRYVADEHQSQWLVSSSKLHCSLSHEIPVYGKAIFQRSSGGELELNIEAMRQPVTVGVAKLISAAPAWKHGARERDLGQVDYATTKTPFRFRRVLSRRVLSELEQGMFPTLNYKDWSDGRDQVEVALSAVNLRSGLGEFLDCLTAQLPFDFKHVRESKLYFSYDSSHLSAKAKQRLDEIADYLLADESVSGVTLYGRTDSRGFRSYNFSLGKRRAESVRDYLVGKGVNAKKFTIKVKSLGERRPLASNRTAKGRSLNRVVEVSLLK